MQGELFEVKAPMLDASKLSQPGWIDRFRITLRLDHLAVGAILALVLYVLVFSFGVEKGKRFALAELAAKELASVTSSLQEAAPLPASAEPALVPEEIPAPQETALETAPEPSQVTGKYTIQLITFTSRAKAENEVKRLEKLGHRSFIIPGGKFYQVCIDAFQEMSEAKDGLTRLKADGFASPDAFIRPLKGQLA
jgi:cell division septation protein DedD